MLGIQEQQRKLIIHFDARNTIFLADKNSRISAEEALNTYISGLIWGVVDSNGFEDQTLNELNPSVVLRTQISTAQGNYNSEFLTVNKEERPITFASKSCETTIENMDLRLLPKTWRKVSQKPLLGPPIPNAQSVYKVLEELIVHESSDRPKLRKRLGAFTMTPEGRDYRQLFEDHIKLVRLPNNLQMTELVKQTFVVYGRDNRPYHYLLPAYLRVIDWLIDGQRPHAVIIRSFGCDLPYVLSATDAFVKGQHPTEKVGNSVPSDYAKVDKVRNVYRSHKEPKYVYEYNEQSLHSPEEIYQAWSDEQGVVGVRDDFEFWYQNNYRYNAAKPFWFDLEDTSVQHIFFDDNILLDKSDTNGVHLMHLEPAENQPKSSRDLHHAELKQWENIFFVQPDLLAAIRDSNYYIKKVKECIQNYDKILYGR